MTRRHQLVARWLARTCGAVFLTAALGVAAAVAAEQPAEHRDTPLSPDEELKSFQLADKRHSIELVAAEPQLDSPVAIAWDCDGRLFVAEMIDYPLGPTAGQIRLLEDADGDGRYEKATVFASGLRFPNGVFAASGGLFVTAAPDLLFLRDTDGDGKADGQQAVFTGFGEGNQQLRANGLTWGIDNWIYGANGRSDGNIVRPGEPIAKAVSIRARDFRFKPDGSQFEATSGQSQFGQASDDWGNRFISWNTIPIRHALFDQAFLDRNPRLGAYGVLDIADPVDTGQVFPVSPRPQTFNRERTDYYNALCGLTIYRGDVLGPQYVGSAMVGESLTNLVHRRLLTHEGPTFVSRRGEHDREFLASTDPWFHPVYMTTGPDGALYVVDFYRRWVEHPAFVPEKLRSSVDWRTGSGHGRIWKVSRRELTWPPRPAPKMSSQSTQDVARHIDSPNGWLRDTAQRVLVERGDVLAAPALRGIVQRSRVAPAKLNALGALDGLGQLDDSTLLRAMEDAEGHVRQYAVRLAAPRLATNRQLRDAALKLANFPHPLVRFEVSRSLAALDGPQKLDALVTLANLEAADPWIPIAIVGSLGDAADEFLSRLVASEPGWRRNPKPAQTRLLSLVAATIVDHDERGSPVQCLQVIAATDPATVGPGDLAILSGLARGLADRGSTLLSPGGSSDKIDAPHDATLRALLTAARAMATSDDESLDHRLIAVDVLGQLDPAAGAILIELVDPRHPQELQSAAAGSLGTADAETAAGMLASWATRTTATRRALAAAALRSKTGTTALVSAIEAGEIQLRELDTSIRDSLAAVRDPQLAPRIKPMLDSVAAADRGQVVARFEPALARHGDRARGAAVFQKQCLACHTLQGWGHRVGPDLSGMAARAKETLLVDLFDPGRQIAPDYVAYTLVTRQGQVLSGLLASETATSVTLRRAEGAQDFVLRSQIEELRGTGKSLMPEGLETNLSEEDVADLLAFLARPEAGLFSSGK